MSNFSNLSRQIVPYNITGLQDINVNTINGTVPFNGVIANPNYPLSFNTTTGILSQTPITQNINTGASPSFSNLTLTGSTLSTTSTSLNINAGNFTTNFSRDGIHGSVSINCSGTTTSGGVNFHLPNGTTQFYMYADTSYAYFYNFGAPSGMNFTSVGTVYFTANTNNLGGRILFKNYNLDIVSLDTNGLIIYNGYPITSTTGRNLILNAPTGQTINFNINNTNKFYVNSSGIYAISLPSATQTYLLGYNTSTGQITYQSPPTVPLSITVNNIASDSSNDLSLSSANNNVNITAMSAIGGTGAGNININAYRAISFLYNNLEIAKLDYNRITFTNLSSSVSYNSPIYFAGTNTSYITSGTSTIGFLTGNNIFSVSPSPSGEMLAKINNITILKINSSGLTTNNIKSNTASSLTLDGNLGIDFNVNGITYAQMTSTGLLVNNVNSIAGQDLFLSSITGIIKTDSSFNMYGGYLNLFDYSTGLIESRLLTDTTGLIISTPSTKDMRFKIGTNTILSITSAGITSPLSDFYIQNTTSSVGRIILKTAQSVSVVDASNNFIVLFNFFGGQIYYPYFSSGYYAMIMQTSALTTYYYHYINGTTYQIINSASVGVQLTYGGTSWGAVSDIRLKKNIQPLKNSLDLINKLNPITYNWKDENMTNNNIGFIAQEVQEILPEITEDYDIKGDKYLGIRTTDLIPFLVKSIQELSKELNDIKTILKRNNIKY